MEVAIRHAATLRNVLTRHEMNAAAPLVIPAEHRARNAALRPRHLVRA
jgi:hypothetical protein